MKRKWILIVSTVLVVAMTISMMLSGCKTTSTTTTAAETTAAAETTKAAETTETTTKETIEGVKKQKITVWYTTSSPVIKDYMETKYQEKFPNLEVEYSWYSSEDLKNQTRIAVESGTPPDIFGVNNGALFWEFVDKGAVLDITKYADEKNLWERAGKDFFKLVMKDDKLYGMPHYPVTVQGVLYVNRDILKKCGITEDPKTVDDLIKVCNSIRKSGYQPIAFGNKDGWPAILLMGDYFLNFDFYDMIPNDDTIEKVNKGELKWQDAEGLVKGLENVVKLARAGVFMDGYSTSDHNAAIQTFVNGKSAFLLMGSWWISTLEKPTTDLPFDLDVIWLPRASSDGEIKGVQMASSLSFVISSKCKNPDAAADWLDFISTKDFQKVMCEVEQSFSIYPGLNSELNIAPVFKKDPIIKQFDYPPTNVFFDWAFPVPVITVMKAQIQQAMDGKITVKDAIAEIQKATDKELKK